MFVVLCVIILDGCMIVILIYNDDCDVCSIVYCNVDDVDECDDDSEYDK